MLLPVRDQGQGRRRRSYSHGSVYGGNHAARSSKLSLLSAITAQSSGSNGSNSTVTQESYNRSIRKRKSSRRKKDTSRSRPAAMDPVEEGSLEGDPGDKKDEKPDVFAYLVEDRAKLDVEARPSSPLKSEDEDEAEPGPEPEPVPYPGDAVHNPDFSTQSFHSDSGVSMDDGSYVPVKTVLQPKLPTSAETGDDTRLGGELNSGRRMEWRYPEIPKPRHRPFTPRENGSANQDSNRLDAGGDREYRSPSPPSVFADDDATFPLSSDHLAAELANLDSPPVFKAFKKTNYRILLQLQDEIIELEDELAHLDTYDGSRRLSKDASTGETLQRLSWHWGQCPFDLYKAKADVLGRMQIRMDQYYKTLILSQKVHRLHPSPSRGHNDLLRFRKTLENHFHISRETPENPDTGFEAHFSFLHDEKDLISIGPSSMSATSSGPSFGPLSLVPLVIPLALFKIFTGVINRLLIVALTLAFSVGISGHAAMANWPGGLDCQRHVQQGLIVSACISVLVGLLV